jgi:hypothetical protein
MTTNIYVKQINGGFYLYEQSSVREGARIRTPTKYLGGLARFIASGPLTQEEEDEEKRKKRSRIALRPTALPGTVRARRGGDLCPPSP